MESSHFSSFQEWRGVCRLSVRPSVNFCANRFFSQTNGQIATKLSQDGLQVSMHPGCAQGQGQRSRDTHTFLDSWLVISSPCGTLQNCFLRFLIYAPLHLPGGFRGCPI